MIRTVAAAAAVAALASPAFAGERVIRLSDFDLSQTADVERLEQTIEREARRVCETAGRPTLSEITASQACQREAIASARSQAGLNTIMADVPAKRAVIASK